MNHIIEQQKERAIKASTGVDLQNRTWVETKDVHTIIEETHQATIAEVVRIAHEMAGHSTIGSRARLLNLHQFIEAITSNKE